MGLNIATLNALHVQFCSSHFQCQNVNGSFGTRRFCWTHFSPSTSVLQQQGMSKRTLSCQTKPFFFLKTAALAPYGATVITDDHNSEEGVSLHTTYLSWTSAKILERLFINDADVC